ncbi:MAG: hypothetical protein ACFFCM_02150, partial [Promethearchaeota archaeon]
LNFIVSGYIHYDFDRISYIFKLPTVLVTYSLLARLLFKFMEVSGYKTKKYMYIRIFFSIIATTLPIINLFTFYQSYFYEPFGFYMFMVNPILRIIIYCLYTPYLLFIGIKGQKLLIEIKNKDMKKRISYIFTIFGILILGRLLNLGYFLPFSNHILTYIIDYLILSISLLFLSYFAIKYPKMLQSISTYFSVKSIYIIQKSGILIFDYDFRKEITEDSITPRQILLGGFMHTLNKGLKSFFELTGEVNTINFGNIIVLVKHGKHIIAILSASENNPMVHKKLSLLIEKFETMYEKELENWTEDYVFNSEDIENMIYEIFR